MSLLIYDSLCSLHASGKKHLFAEFIKRTRGEIEQAVKDYVTNFPNDALYKFLKASFPMKLALEIMTNQQSICRAAEMIQHLFRGEETTYSDDYSVLKMD